MWRCAQNKKEAAKAARKMQMYASAIEGKGFVARLAPAINLLNLY